MIAEAFIYARVMVQESWQGYAFADCVIGSVGLTKFKCGLTVTVGSITQ